MTAILYTSTNVYKNKYLLKTRLIERDSDAKLNSANSLVVLLPPQRVHVVKL